MKYSKDEVLNAQTMLKQYCPKGATIHSVIRNVSRSGMSRRIDFYVIDGTRLQYLTGWMSVLFDRTRSDHGMRVDGCGMDMCWHTVEQLSSALYGRAANQFRSQVI